MYTSKFDQCKFADLCEFWASSSWKSLHWANLRQIEKFLFAANSLSGAIFSLRRLKICAAPRNCVGQYSLVYTRLKLFFDWLSDPPNVIIQLGKSLISTEIRQGIDVYFDCIIHANPSPKSKIVTWLHNVSTSRLIVLVLTHYYYVCNYFQV